MTTLSKLSISDLPAINVDGVYRVLGCIPETDATRASFPRFGFGAAPLSPSQWREIDLSWMGNPILDQMSTSSCVGHGVASGGDLCYMQSGRKLPDFNPYFTYALVNGGRDAGAMISDALRAMMVTGFCPKADSPSGVMFKQQFPTTSFAAASRFKLAQAYACHNFEEICAAITLGFIVPLGIYVDNNFANLDNEGVSGVPSGNRGGGHCTLGMGLKKSTRYGWLIKIQNSWGRFGMNGYSYIHKGHFQRMNPDAFAIQSMIEDPQNDDLPVFTGLSMNGENLNLSAINMGFDPVVVADILKNWGEPILTIAIELARNGLTTATIIEILFKFGPKFLEFLVDFINRKNSFGLTGNFDGTDEILAEILLEKCRK